MLLNLFYAGLCFGLGVIIAVIIGFILAIIIPDLLPKRKIKRIPETD